MRAGRTERLSAVFLLLLLAFGCSGGSEGPTTPATDSVEGATLAVSRVTSLERVPVLGLPLPRAGAARAAAPYDVVLRVAGLDDIEFGLELDVDGWFFLAPLHPATPNEGGELEVLLRSSSQESAALPLRVDPLPAAPGAFAAVVAKLREHFELMAAQWGTSLAELKATAVDELDPGMLPLKLSQSYLDSDLDPHDLTDLAANLDGFLDAEAMGILDRMFGYCDFESLLQEQIDALAAQPESAILPLVDGPDMGRRLCIDRGPEIGSAPELSQAMIRSAVGAIGADPQSAPGRILSAGGTYLAGVSVIPGAGLPAAVGSIALAEFSAVAGAFAGLNPSYFVSIESQVEPREFDEDTLEHATWSNVWVVAASTGWSADAILANVVVNLVGGGLSEAGAAKILGSDLARDVTSIGVGLGAAEVFGETDLIEFCPRQWRIDISSPLYCTATAVNRRFDVDVAGQTAEPSEPGVDQLRVAAQAPQFGGRTIHEDHAMLVRQIQVVMTPDEIVVETPGQDIAVTAEIHNAQVTSLRWTPEKGAWNDGVLGSDTSDGRTRTLTTPTAPEDYPFEIRVESLSRQGMRESGIPARIGYATVRTNAARVVVEPPYVCITPGETQQFEASVTGARDSTVVWSVTEGYGSIDQNGLYRSLAGGTSNAVIEARLQENTEVYGTARLDASACNCTLDVKITGDAVWNATSSQAAYLVADFGELFYQFFFDIGSGGPPGIAASLGGFEDEPAPEPGDTGSWKAGFTFYTAGESWISIWDDPDIPLPGVTLTITELTATTMVGTFSGNAFQLNENGEISSIVGVDVSFRAGHWDGGGWPCE